MKSNNAPVEDTAAKLQHNYQDVLRRRITELRIFASRCREGKLLAEEIEDIHLRVRSLVGSGTTYGYPDVSAAADPLDQALDNPSMMGLKAIIGLAENLALTCENAVMKDIAAAGDNILVFKVPPPQPGASKLLMLMVDDDPAIHDFVKAMFKNSMRILSAYNGAEAIEAVRQHSPDIILLDNYMPGTDGLQLLEKLGNQKNSSATPVIMLTADDGPQEIMRAASAGVADYVTKPFEPGTLADKIIAIMRRMQTTVLVAHANPVMRDLIAGRLRRTGLTVIEATNGRDILTLAAARMPELILLDQSLPGMESGGVLHNLRTDRPTRHIPVLYLAPGHMGYGTLENLDTGSSEPVTMPSPPEKVVARIMDALGFESQFS